MLTERQKKEIQYAASSDGYFGPFDWEDIESRINSCPQHIIDERKKRWEEVRKQNPKTDN
jgi:hypothetical protein